jgi:hypothetical protein
MNEWMTEIIWGTNWECLGKTEKNHKELQSIQSVSQPGFEPDSTKIQLRNFTAWADLFRLEQFEKGVSVVIWEQIHVLSFKLIFRPYIDTVPPAGVMYHRTWQRIWGRILLWHYKLKRVPDMSQTPWKKNLCDRSSQANYTDRATAACQRN